MSPYLSENYLESYHHFSHVQSGCRGYYSWICSLALPLTSKVTDFVICLQYLCYLLLDFTCSFYETLLIMSSWFLEYVSLSWN